MSDADKDVVVQLSVARGAAAQRGEPTPSSYCRDLLEALPAAVYATNAAGRVTFFNRAAAEMAGRRPRLDADTWCVSWRLFWPDGRPMPHEDCPMAVALKDQRPVRGQEIVIQRPDGTRVFALPYPTPLHDADGTLIGAVNLLVDITERKEIERDLHRLTTDLEVRVEQRTRELARTVARLEESERISRLLIEGVIDYSIFMLDPAGRVTTWNAGAERIKGYTRSEIEGRHFSCFYSEPDRLAGAPEQALHAAREAGRFEAEGWRVRKDGSRFWANVVIDAIHDEAGRLIGFAKITRDLTERRMVEERLRQAQKMEAVGQLTGGIAHDFNNLLTVILGGLETLERSIATPAGPRLTDRARRAMDGAVEGAQRAASLTQRLLAFSRQQPLEPKMVNVATLIGGLSELLRRTLGERISIETVCEADDARVLVDPREFENALLNLAVNARDAMADGGRLTIRTTELALDAGAAARHGFGPGEFVSVSVADTGSGMDTATLERAFEPFFTTKPTGHGTGLGLSMVYGFVQQSGGHVEIESRAGAGTTVRIFLPRFSADETAISADDERNQVRPIARGCSEVVLVVEDNDAVRAHSVEVLRELGYRVLEATNAATALAALARQPGIRLLFSDIGLPGEMNGRRLAEEARRLHPGLKVLLTTGYARGVAATRRLEAGVLLLRKPFGFAELAATLRDVLDP
ncbi:MAG: PAS domain S-box protein [Acetobacteraceae bacterium]|nr:PAS domain S-box protein [Acetobacteraceae bacterium]